MPIACVVWSLISAVTFTFAMIYPVHLLHLFDRFFLLAVCMLMGGLSLLPITHAVTEIPSFFTPRTTLDLFVIVVLGTVVAFFTFNVGLRWLSPEEAAITATIERVASVLFAYFIFDTHFVPMQVFGIFLVVAAIAVPNLQKKRSAA